MKDFRRRLATAEARVSAITPGIISLIITNDPERMGDSVGIPHAPARATVLKFQISLARVTQRLTTQRNPESTQIFAVSCYRGRAKTDSLLGYGPTRYIPNAGIHPAFAGSLLSQCPSPPVRKQLPSFSPPLKSKRGRFCASSAGSPTRRSRVPASSRANLKDGTWSSLKSA